MTTKTEERKALEEMKKIVEGLGPESYIKTAFDGAWEVAESNIDYDFADSVKASREYLEDRAETFQKENLELKKKLENATKSSERMAAANSGLMDKVASLENECEELRDRLETAAKAAEKAEATAMELRDELAAKDQEADTKKDEKIKAQELEIMKLKARLFDLLCK